MGYICSSALSISFFKSANVQSVPHALLTAAIPSITDTFKGREDVESEEATHFGRKARFERHHIQERGRVPSWIVSSFCVVRHSSHDDRSEHAFRVGKRDGDRD